MGSKRPNPQAKPSSPSCPGTHPTGTAGPRPEGQSAECTYSLEARLIVCSVHPFPGPILVSEAHPRVHRAYMVLDKFLRREEGSDLSVDQPASQTSHLEPSPVPPKSRPPPGARSLAGSTSQPRARASQCERTSSSCLHAPPS